MEAIIVKNKKEEKKFLEFRKKIYKQNPIYVDNNFFMLKQVFAKTTCFIKNKEIYPINIEDKGSILCQGIVIYTKELPEYIQLCFFESEKDVPRAVKLLVDKTIEIGKKFKCKKIVIGLCGHVNYGLGFLDSHFNEKNSFSASANPEYYNEYFREMNCSEIYLNTYKVNSLDNMLDKFTGIINKLNKTYTFKFFDKNNFDYYAKIYTDLNNKSFKHHRYYYKRNYVEDVEMLKELFMFMKEESLIFAFEGDKPVGFTMWYPDFNELVKKGDAFGAKEFFKNLFFNKKISKIKVMEYGILPAYQKVGLPIALLNEIYKTIQKYNIKKAETSWILEENKDSNSICQAVCDEMYKRYVVYEKKIR